MPNQSLLQRFFIYVIECIQLLYWSFFKPFTFTEWLEEIHPKLKTYTNPFQYNQEFETRPKLHRYAKQFAWINAFAPFFIVILVVIPYSYFSDISFQWFFATFSFIGWWTGIIIIVFYPNFLKKVYKVWNKLMFIFFLLLISVKFIGQIDIYAIYKYTLFEKCLVIFTFSLIISIVDASFHTTSILLNVMVGVFCTLSAGLNFDITTIFIGIAVINGLTFSILFSVGALDRIFGSVLAIILYTILVIVLMGVIITIITNVMIGTVFVLTGIFNIFRIYFWLPELFWTIALAWLSPWPAKSLRLLPCYFDQVILLPLPFTSRLILRAYRKDPTTAIETISYLKDYTTQKYIADNVVENIIAEILFHSKTVQDISRLFELRPWDVIAQLEIKTIEDKILIDYIKISQIVNSNLKNSSVLQQKKLIEQSLIMLKNVQKKFPNHATTIQVNKSWQLILEKYQLVI